MSRQSPIYSKHIFLFPFRWDTTTKKKSDLSELSLDKRCDIDLFSDSLNKDYWKRGNKEYYINEYRNFGEYVYFYDFVRDALYDENGNNEKILRHYTYELGANSTYSIFIKGNKEPYVLSLVHIYLHVFRNGVGLLSFHLQNDQYKTSKDILKINEFGRRIYPQFLTTNGDPTNSVKEKFLADKISIQINEQPPLEDNFKDYDKAKFDALASHTVHLPNYILSLFNSKKQKFTSCTHNIEKKQICIRPIIDDRMFTICWYGDDSIIKDLKCYPKGSLTVEKEYNFHNSSFWYEYVFIEGGEATCQNRNMLRSENIKHTYERFTDWGTLWGVTRYSFVALTDMGDIAKDLISIHATTMYYQMVVLCLMQRASVLKYSNEISRISRDIKNKHEEIEDINESYLRFMNRMYFREITAQEQGIELYDMLQENMRIEREVSCLNREIDEIYQFTALINEKKQNKLIKNLTILGAIFLPASLIAGILGMNTMPDVNIFPKNICDFLHSNFFPQTKISLMLMGFSYLAFGLIICIYFGVPKILKWIKKLMKRP